MGGGSDCFGFLLVRRVRGVALDLEKAGGVIAAVAFQFDFDQVSTGYFADPRGDLHSALAHAPSRGKVLRAARGMPNDVGLVHK